MYYIHFIFFVGCYNRLRSESEEKVCLYGSSKSNSRSYSVKIQNNEHSLQKKTRIVIKMFQFIFSFKEIQYQVNDEAETTNR